MTDENPYTAPDAILDTGTAELYQPSFFSFNGRIGRLRYLAYGIGVNALLMLVIVPLMGGAAIMGGATMGSESGMSMIGIVLVAVFYILAIMASVMFGKRRLNDLNRSGWWFLLFIVPLVNLALTIYVLFFPGSQGSNNFGSAPAANSLGVKLVAWILPLIMIVGIVAAVSIPAYQEYVMRAQ